MRQELTAGCFTPEQTSHHTVSPRAAAAAAGGGDRNGFVLRPSSVSSSDPFPTGAENPVAP